MYKEKLKTIDNVADNVTYKRLEYIVNLIKQNNQITTTEIAEKTKVTKRTILRDLEKLKNQNKIKRVGSGKSGYWKFN